MEEWVGVRRIECWKEGVAGFAMLKEVDEGDVASKGGDGGVLPDHDLSDRRVLVVRKPPPLSGDGGLLKGGEGRWLAIRVTASLVSSREGVVNGRPMRPVN